MLLLCMVLWIDLRLTDNFILDVFQKDFGSPATVPRGCCLLFFLSSVCESLSFVQCLSSWVWDVCSVNFG